MKKRIYRWLSGFLAAVLLTPLFVTTALAATITLSNGSSLPDTVWVLHNYQLKVEGYRVKFYSSNPKVATVTESGKLKGISPGKALISACITRDDGTRKTVAKKTLTVKQRATAVTANVETLYLTPGEEYTLKPTLTPSTSTDVIRFRSADESIATVHSMRGVVTAKALGETTITIYAKGAAAWSDTNSENRKTTVRVIVREKQMTAEVVGENQIKATFSGNVPGVTEENFSVTQANAAGVSKALGIESVVQYSRNEFLLTLAEPVFSTTEDSAAALNFYSPNEEAYASAYIDLGRKYAPYLAGAKVSGNTTIEEGTSGSVQFFGVDRDFNPQPLENITVNLQSYVDTSNTITLPETGAVMDNVSFRYKQPSDGSIVVTYAAPPDTVAEGEYSTSFAIRLNRKDGSLLFSNVLYVTRAKEGAKYNLSFVSDDGEALFDTLTVRAGTTYETPTPSKEGYTFKGWVRSDGADGNVMPEQDLTLTATWEQIGSTPAAPMIYTTSVATVAMAGWVYGSPVSPTLSNGPTDTLPVTYQYKPAGADDTAWSDAVPADAGDYQVRAIIEVTANYTVMTAAADFTITPKEVTITGTTVESSKVYDGSNSAVITNEGTLNGVVDGDDVSIIPGTAAYDDETVGTGKTVTFTGFKLTGADKDNYVLAAQPDAVTADITNAADVISVDIEWDNMDFTYTAPGKGAWNASTHEYENATAGGWAATGGTNPKITVTNRSSVPVNASFAFATAVDGLNGSFTKTALVLNSAGGTEPSNAPKDETVFSVSGSAIDADKSLGTITVTVTKDTTQYVSTAEEYVASIARAAQSGQ